MAKKPTVTTLASGFNSTETLNANFEALRDGFDNTLSLDGSTPNAMGGDLDLNSNNIINATAIMVGGSDVVATTATALAAAVQAQVDADAAVVASALSETNAANSATASQTSANASQASRLAAELAETNAETAETNAETAAALATTNGAAQVVLATDQVALATTQANLATTNGAAQVVLATDQVALATTQAGLATTNGAAQVALATTQATNAANSATTATAQAVIATTKASEASASATQAAADVASIQGAAGAAVDAANSAAAAAAALDNFDDRYLGPKSSEPTVDNDGDALVSGSLYFSTTSNAMQVYDGANWIAASASGVASMILYEYTATAGQTTFTGSDDNNNSISFIQGNEIVVFNGIILDPSDYNSTSGTSIVLNVAAAVGDLLNVYAFKSFTVADTVPASTGGTFGGDVTVTGTLAATTLTGDGSAITGLPAGYTDTDVATYLAGVGNVVVGGTVDGVDIAARDAILTSTTTTANAALPKAGGTMTGVIAGFESTGIDDNATSTAITIDASENVGIGTSSPSPNKIAVNGDQVLLSNGALKFADAGNSHVGLIKNSGTSGTGQLEFYTGPTTTEAMRIDSSGQLIIKTAGGALQWNNGYQTITGDAVANDLTYRTYQNHIFKNTTGPSSTTDGTEVMRLDSSGNLLVGHTSTYSPINNGGDGVTLSANGEIFAGSSQSSGVMLLNRENSDGSILTFRKDGSTVGSIGSFTVGTSAMFFGSLDTALLANSGNDSIHPWNASTNSNRDNAIDLGNASNRFKDAHFSGTVNANSFSGDGSGLTGTGASTTFGAVGTYTRLGIVQNGTRTAVAGGTSYSASSLKKPNVLEAHNQTYVNKNIGNTASGLSGTWRTMHDTVIEDSSGHLTSALFVRIS